MITFSYILMVLIAVAVYVVRNAYIRTDLYARMRTQDNQAIAINYMHRRIAESKGVLVYHYYH